MSNDESAFWVEWPAGMNHVVFADLPHMIALAMWPEVAANSDHRDFAYGGARINLETELPKAVRAGLLKVRDPLTLGPHTFPIGDALKGAFVLLPDLREFLSLRGGGIGVRVGEAEPGSLPRARESSAERCARLYKELQQEEKKKKWGALAKVVERDGRARQTVSADIKKGREAEAARSSSLAAMVRVIRR